MKNIFKYLAAAGTIPFFVGAVDAVFGLLDSRAITETAHVYALVILSFMAGAIWGLALGKNVALLLYSNIITLLGWAVYLKAGSYFSLAMAVLFLLLLPADRICLQLGLIDRTYMKLRLVITAIVVVCLIIMAGYGA